jgi:2'-5' RNA ligase
MAGQTPSFAQTWARFQALDSLLLLPDTLESAWTRGRTHYLAFLVPIEDAAARRHIAMVADRIRAIPGVDPYPESYWHITIKGIGFEVAAPSSSDELPPATAELMASAARSILAPQPGFQVELGLPNGFPEVVFLEVLDRGRIRSLNTLLLEGVPGILRYPIDGPVFLPHVSVARFSSNEGVARLKAALAALRDEGPGPSFAVRHVQLIKARLSEEAPTFQVLADYVLG